MSGDWLQPITDSGTDPKFSIDRALSRQENRFVQRKLPAEKLAKERRR
jgi:hypothetical protein